MKSIQFSHFADKTVQDQGTNSTTVLKGMFSVSKMARYAAPLEGAMHVFTTGKQRKSETMFAGTSNPFVKVSILFSKMESAWPNHLPRLSFSMCSTEADGLVNLNF